MATARGAPRLHVLLASALVSAAACGGAAAGGGEPQTPVGVSTVATTGGSATPLPSASASTTSTGSAGTAATGTVPPPAHVDMKPPIPSGMVADLQALGIDAKSLPPIEKLDPKALRGAMKLIARSLGAKCGDCHQEGDFAASTRRKKIAARMWNEMAAKLTTADGQPVFCDSCHQGRIVQLDRTDKKALGKWMDASFVAGLKRKDGQAQECESCHVDMEMRFLTKWGQ